MLMRRSLWCALAGTLFIAALGCRSHPELSKTNDQGTSEWRRLGVPTHSVYSIKAGNRIDTPAGEKVLSLNVGCDSEYKTLELGIVVEPEPESGAVTVGFDDALAQKTWNVKPNQIKDHVFYGIRPTDSDQPELVRQLRRSKNFQFEFTPKGGKPQRSNFNLLNIGTLMDQDPNCKEPAPRAQ